MNCQQVSNETWGVKTIQCHVPFRSAQWDLAGFFLGHIGPFDPFPWRILALKYLSCGLFFSEAWCHGIHVKSPTNLRVTTRAQFLPSSSIFHQIRQHWMVMNGGFSDVSSMSFLAIPFDVNRVAQTSCGQMIAILRNKWWCDLWIYTTFGPEMCLAHTWMYHNHRLVYNGDVYTPTLLIKQIKRSSMFTGMNNRVDFPADKGHTAYCNQGFPECHRNFQPPSHFLGPQNEQLRYKTRMLLRWCLIF